jgi:hypothetical protein
VSSSDQFPQYRPTDKAGRARQRNRHDRFTQRLAKTAA